MEKCRLPQELICVIIDNFQSHDGYLDENATNTLRTCSLVCRSWRPLCQRLLFHTITFGTSTCCRTGTGTDTAAWSLSRRLDRVLLSSPHLTGYIRNLRPRGIACQTCGKGDETFPSVLRKLGNLQKLELVGLRWSTLTVDLKQSLCWALQLPSITRLGIEGGSFRSLDDFFNFISHAQDLTALSLFDINTSSTDDEPLTPGDQEEIGGGRIHTWNKWGRLSELRLMSYSHPSTVLIDWLLGPRSFADVSHVETLRVVPPPGDAVNRLLCSIGSTLKNLELHTPPDLFGE
jgi:hypothetical protein